MTNLTHTQLQELKTNIETALEKWSINYHKSEPRTHLGISEIGENCKRKLYYKFRWFAFEKHDGRILRLFARGHREEEKYINYLEGIGCRVNRFSNPILNYHPENDDYFLSDKFKTNGLVKDVTGLERHEIEAAKRGLERKQFRVSGVMGHYGGSCDGVVFTSWYPDIPMILECKTHNTKSFVHYVDKGLQISKPKHYDQMSCYGEKMGIQYGLYFPENKNDDDIQITAIKLDWDRAKQLEIKAQEIITANEPPPRISDNPAFWECKFCAFINVCHHEAIPQKNCRSCKNSKTTKEATWTCNKFGLIPSEFVKIGCNEWMPI